MRFILWTLLLFSLSSTLWSYTRGQENYEPVIIPEKTDPFIQKKKEMPETRAFYVAGSFGYLFASAYDITVIQTDFSNAGVTGLSPVSGFLDFKFEFGYENILPHFDVFTVIGYVFTPTKSGTGDINYGLEPVNTTVSFGLYSVPILIGGKYSFYNTDIVKLGARADVGMSLIRGNIDLKLNGTSLLPVQSSSLSYGGTGINMDFLMFIETKLSKMLNLEFNLGYSVTSLSNVKILGSTGSFLTQFQPGKQLMIYDSTTGQSEAFKVRLNGLVFSLSAKILF